MSNFALNEHVWWFYTDSTTGNVYPDWLSLCKGKVVWLSPDEEIMHVYIDGESNIYTVLDASNHVFFSKEAAIDAMLSKIKSLEGTAL